MAKNSIDAYAASGKTNLLFFDPDTLVLVTDKASPLYDERVHLPVDENLARNIDYQGVLQPIAVSKNPETGDVEVAIGRQRTKAARLANEWRRARGVEPILIPGFVHRGDRRNALDVIIGENELRQADTPIGRAGKMRDAMALGRSEEQLAMLFGCTPQTVKATLALLECCSAVQQAVEREQISVTHARQLVKLTPAEQREKVRDLVAAGSDKPAHAKAKAQRAVMGDAAPRMKTRKQILAELESASGAKADALRWVLGMEAAGTLPGLTAAVSAFRDLDATTAKAA
ncbi:ParB/RepB/Spo0J family partition protein [Cupriavidus campinensis]|uniref:ParB N-terminal domain-containing protein n=1 Tax=Cupriavidus campinensis TaxID=151783 RepID=A0AAE9HW90_9BURK|nr:ParB N-terminal domain-containing protein [Cupriavidus campinensis]URF02814.1 ParB N-terminal domain-containing protein [Cupriavidus campinensis]